VYIKEKCIFQYRIWCPSMGVCQEINFGSQKLDFSMTKTSHADLFQNEVRYKVRRHMVCLLLLLRSKRAMFYINLHGRVVCETRPARKGPSRFLVTGYTNKNVQYIPYTSIHPQLLPFPTPPALPARYATLRSQPTTPYLHTFYLLANLY
jgi:hypothetical protein